MEDPAVLLERRTSHVLLLVWHFAAEVLGQQQENRPAGGRIIIPFPKLQVV